MIIWEGEPILFHCTENKRYYTSQYYYNTCDTIEIEKAL